MAKKQRFVEYNGGRVYTSIFVTPSGSRVAQIGSGFYKVVNKNQVINVRYLRCDGDKELWQNEFLDENGRVIRQNQVVRIKQKAIAFA